MCFNCNMVTAHQARPSAEESAFVAAPQSKPSTKKGSRPETCKLAGLPSISSVVYSSHDPQGKLSSPKRACASWDNVGPDEGSEFRIV